MDCPPSGGLAQIQHWKPGLRPRRMPSVKHPAASGNQRLIVPYCDFTGILLPLPGRSAGVPDRGKPAGLFFKKSKKRLTALFENGIKRACQRICNNLKQAQTPQSAGLHDTVSSLRRTQIAPCYQALKLFRRKAG